MRRLRLAALVLVSAAAGGCEAPAPGNRVVDAPRAGGTARVERVVDGDTVRLGSGVGRARLIGVDTPEVHGDAECFGPEASRFARRLLPRGARVRYELGVDPRDRYDRALVHLWLPDGRFLNAVLVAEGYARPLAVAPNVEHAARFARLARRARREGRGLWAACGPDPVP